MENDFKEGYLKAQSELTMLYEIGNAMRTTLNLEEILYVILTAVTSHTGLSFNRAMLFLVNEKDNKLEGKMGIGPDSGQDANVIWAHIKKHKLGLEELIDVRGLDHLKISQLNKNVKSIKIPISNDLGIVSYSVTEGMPFIISIDEIKDTPEFEYLTLLNLELFVTVPLKARDKIIGIIFADNLFDKKPITEDDIRMLTMFANQAGLAIENSRLYERTVTLSNTDSLTGLWHHGFFQYLLNRAIENALSEKSYFSLLMIDIDNFKQYNDTYGHQAGDKILKDISNIFKDASRKIDDVARYGGEEFSVILPDTRKEEAKILAERLRKTIEKSPSLQGIKVSIGVSSFPDDAEVKEELILKADKALYKAKKSGKNKVCISNI
ncbi:MAG: sensor domain-containing diguanylate cyclase [Candidatus Omnitrophota bacterium]